MLNTMKGEAEHVIDLGKQAPKRTLTRGLDLLQDPSLNKGTASRRLKETPSGSMVCCRRTLKHPKSRWSAC